jgi:hypothetical protein
LIEAMKGTIKANGPKVMDDIPPFVRVRRIANGTSEKHFVTESKF